MDNFWNVLGDELLNAGHPVMQQLAAQKLIDEGIIRRPSQTAFPVQVQKFAAPVRTLERDDRGNDKTPLFVAAALIVIVLLIQR